MARRSRFNNPVPSAPTRARPERQGGVSGPTSALTSFLREHGIVAPNVSRFTRVQPGASSEASGSAAVPGPQSSSTLEARPATRQEQEAEKELVDEEPDSDNLDDHVDQGLLARSKKGKALASCQAPSQPEHVAQETPAASTKKMNSDEEDGDWKPKPGKYHDRKPGHITTCSECGKRFTVSRYTLHAPGKQGQLCDDCAELDSVPKADLRPSKAPKKKRKVMATPKQAWSENSIQTLQMACITVLASNIESFEALGHVGSVNLDKICQIVCKHRELKPSTLPLFLDIQHTDLRLYDCIHLRKDELRLLPTFCPRLERLKLNLCGHLDGEVLLAYAQGFAYLVEIDLFGPYLVRKEAWLEAFQIWNTTLTGHAKKSVDHVEQLPEGSKSTASAGTRGGQLSAFRLKQAPRFDLECFKALVATCQNLVDLKLDDMGLLDDCALDAISSSGLKQIRRLTIANAGITNGSTGEKLTDLAVVRLLKSFGVSLEVLDISLNKKLTDVTIVDGVAANCRRLHHLNISGLQLVTNAGAQTLFTTLKKAGATPLQDLDISRCIQVGNEGLFALLDHSAKSLTKLNLNSVDDLRAEALERLSMEATNLVHLDLSFVRDVDDFIIKALVNSMPQLKSLMVFGNNRVSDQCPTRKGLHIQGQERSIVV